LTNESKLRVFTSRMPKIFGLKREEVTREWRKLYNEELDHLYYAPNFVRVIKSRRMAWAGHVELVGERRGLYRVLVGKAEGKRPFGTPRHGWKDNSKMDLQEVECGGWTGSSWLRIRTSCRNFWMR